jgi:outer membrane biosynthesis protein TonB
MIENPQEKKNKQIALVTTVGVHMLLFLLFLFVIAWRAPDPPLPEYGIELNFGVDEVGAGSTQPDEPAGSQQPSEDEVEESNTDQQESQEQVQEETTQEESTPVQEQAVTPQESTVAVKEEKKTETKPVEKPKEQEKKEVVKTETKPVETTQKTQTQTTAEKTTTDNKEGKPISHGDDVNKTGDKGDPKGELDNKALYGKQGGGNNGAGLDLAGWNWDYIPNPNVPNNETGRVVFEIKVDDSGEIISIRTIERSVSLEAENICRKEVEKLTFSKTGTNVPAISTGRITFVIRSK